MEWDLLQWVVIGLKTVHKTTNDKGNKQGNKMLIAEAALVTRA